MKQCSAITWLGGRKFIIAILLVISATVLGMFDKLESGAIGIVLGLVGAGYGFANVASNREKH